MDTLIHVLQRQGMIKKCARINNCKTEIESCGWYDERGMGGIGSTSA
ncbi:hypothetical protein D1AOALGA4SA_5146 [Olavius algarvensis Delta 1 endosymbiont]|nr:hypothetical protein D1AOALGA4SA_5146 [Olavius algarvensis Delta 1 endosymbiont]